MARAYRAIRNCEKLRSSEVREINGMAIAVITSVLALGGTGWESVAGQLLASGVLLLSVMGIFRQPQPRYAYNFPALIDLPGNPP